ncbi:MAG: YIP1 family protein [Anaerolineae bacterium]|nr:YIP1 family protein [Anaerolineae bacterium]
MLLDRIMGVFKLDANVFTEIEHDQDATSQAAIIVAIVAFLAAIGSGVGAAMSEGSFIGNFLFSLVWTFIAWFIWSGVTYFVGTNLFKGDADMGEMLRVIGFAYAPQMLSIIPCFGSLIGGIWSLIASIVAIREGMDFDSTKAVFTVLIGWIIVFILSIVLGSVFGLGAMGLSAITSQLG